MLFLIEYYRPKCHTVSLRTFPDEEYETANKLRFDREMELFLAGDDDTEVVVLQAVDERQIRRTHSRYFGGESDLLEWYLAGRASRAALRETGESYEDSRG